MLFIVEEKEYWFSRLEVLPLMLKILILPEDAMKRREPSEEISEVFAIVVMLICETNCGEEGRIDDRRRNGNRKYMFFKYLYIKHLLLFFKLNFFLCWIEKFINKNVAI